MTRNLQRQLREPNVVKKIFDDEAIKQGLDNALTTSLDQVYSQGNPTYFSHYPGTMMRFHFAHHAAKELKDYGFEADEEKGQIFAVSNNSFDCPVRIISAVGTVNRQNGIATYNWSKGPLTSKRILANKLGMPPLQPMLWENMLWENIDIGSLRVSFDHLTLCVLYRLQQKQLTGWLVLGTEWTDKSMTMLHCPINSLICTKDLTLESLPDFHNPFDTDDDYDISI